MNQKEEAVTTEFHGPVALVRFQPRADGTISNKGAVQLANRFRSLLEDRQVRAIVLTGAEQDIFIRHANLGQIYRAAEALEKGQIGESDFVGTPFPQLCDILDRSEKPVIAAINGTCMGGGFEIALACTLRIAAPTARLIGLPEIRLGILPGSGGPQRLANLIGAHRARAFILEGTIVPSETALAMHIIDEISPDPVQRALERAGHIARRSPEAVAAIMRELAPDHGPATERNALDFAGILQTNAARQMLEEQLHNPRPIETLD